MLTLGLAITLLFGAQEGDTSFRLAAANDFVQLPLITVPSTVTAWILILVCAALTALSVVRLTQERNTPLWLVAAFAVAWMAAFLTWAAAGHRVPVIGLLGGALALAVPLVFGALGGVLGERAGVVNIAIDGQLLFGAFAAAMVGSLTGSTWVGLVAAMFAGLVVASVLGLFAINYLVDQVIVGVVLNVLIIGITSFMFSQVLAPNSATLNDPPRFARAPIPRAGRHPADRADLLPADRRSSTCSTSPSPSSPGRCGAPGGACASARSASTPRPPTPSASRSTAPASARSCWPARSWAWVARSTRWCRCRSSTAR